MKKITFILAALFLFSCSSSKLSVSGEAESEFVNGFLKHMVDNTSTASKILKDYISPTFLKENNIDITSKSVNVYSPDEFGIEKYDRKEGIVTAKIWGKDKDWVHRLHFKVEKIDGKLYLYGKTNNDSYVDPWFSVESFIKE